MNVLMAIFHIPLRARLRLLRLSPSRRRRRNAEISRDGPARWRPAPGRKLCRPNLSASPASTRRPRRSSTRETGWPRILCNWCGRSPSRSAVPLCDSRGYLVDDAGSAGPCVLEATAGRTGPRGRSMARPKRSSGSEAAMEQPLAVDAENSRAKVQNVGGDSSRINSLETGGKIVEDCCA